MSEPACAKYILVCRWVRARLLAQHKPLQPTRAPDPISRGREQVANQKRNENGNCLVHGSLTLPQRSCQYDRSDALKHTAARQGAAGDHPARPRQVRTSTSASANWSRTRSTGRCGRSSVARRQKCEDDLSIGANGLAAPRDQAHFFEFGEIAGQGLGSLGGVVRGHSST